MGFYPTSKKHIEHKRKEKIDAVYSQVSPFIWFLQRNRIPAVPVTAEPNPGGTGNRLPPLHSPICPGRCALLLSVPVVEFSESVLGHVPVEVLEGRQSISHAGQRRREGAGEQCAGQQYRHQEHQNTTWRGVGVERGGGGGVECQHRISGETRF